MESLNSISGYLTAHSGEYIIALGIIAILAVILALQTAFGLRSLCKPMGRLAKGLEGEEPVLPALVKTVEDHAKSIETIQAAIASIERSSRRFFKHIGLMRYDAFDDIGGQQSYSLCLLDDDKNGFLVTYLTGKNFTRSYAVSIAAGQHSRKLGEEEQ
ncbi:MAG: DUF4446 family protein, partial [Chitinivibrionia bacterium]|nr:DUF4446 family protein [Chitinivibrionia bacterium]